MAEKLSLKAGWARERRSGSGCRYTSGVRNYSRKLRQPFDKNMAEKPTLLIVDDEKPTRDGLRAALEERYDVYVADDAKSALELLEAEHFDGLLTAFRLPN